jgi:type I restriction enzyme M protein
LRFRTKIDQLVKIDKDTIDIFGHVNTSWVFREVAKALSYEIFMAEVDNVGYKRTKRGERRLENDLFRSDASGRLIYEPDPSEDLKVLDYLRGIAWD